jgi:hypothetical protein
MRCAKHLFAARLVSPPLIFWGVPAGLLLERDPLPRACVSESHP